MSSAAEVVKAALRRINVVARGEEVAPEDGAEGLEALKNMLISWETDGVRLAPDMPLPARHKQAIIALLAVRLAPDYSKVPSALLLEEAEDGYAGLLAEYIRAPRIRTDAVLTSFPSQRIAWDGISDYRSWRPNTAYAIGDAVANSGRTYECTAPGISASSVGPVTTDTTETDGSVTWTFTGTL